jgi:hypothetical protein
VSTAYSHVWRAAGADIPCDLTGREGPDSNGQIYVEITNKDGTTSIPREQLITIAAWKAEQARAAQKAPSAANACLIAALRYAERGWMIFSVPFGTKKSYHSARGGNGRAWGMTRDPMEIEGYFKEHPTAGVGIPTGKVNGFFVLETDTLAGNGVSGVLGLRALEAKHAGGVPLPETLMAESPTGSVHRYFAWPNAPGVDIRNSDSTLAPGVDIRANGGMVVAPPTRTPKGQYRWLNDLPLAEAPDWLIKLIEKGDRSHRAPNAPRNAKYKPIEDDQLRELMECVPNDDRTTWEDWNRVGMALYAATNGSWFGA